MLDATAGCADDAEGGTSTDVDPEVDSVQAQDALPGAAELAPRAMLPSESLGSQRGSAIALAPATGGGDASDRLRVMQQPHAVSTLLPCYVHGLAMRLPCHRHAVAMLLQ